MSSLDDKLKKIEDDIDNLYKQKSEIEKQKDQELYETIISSKILSTVKWQLDWKHPNVNCYVFYAIGLHYWHELEDIMCIPKCYHWYKNIDKNLSIGCNDGEILLTIREDALLKYISLLELTVDTNNIAEAKREYTKKIDELTAHISKLDKLVGDLNDKYSAAREIFLHNR